jgi:transposase
MPYGYSNDLRQKAIDYYARNKVTQREVSEIFGISLRTLGDWIRRDKTGSCNRCDIRTKQPHKIDSIALRAYIAAHPDSYLREIAAHFNVSDVGIIKALRRLGISRKKNQPVSGTRRG